MKSNIFIGAFLLISSVSLNADGAAANEESKECYAKFQPTAPIKAVHEHRFNFGFLNIGYERIKPDSVYTGFETKIASLLHAHDEHNVTFDHFVNSELRLGYNHILGQKDNIIGYGGVGFSMFSVEKVEGKLKNWSYGTIGFKYLHQFGEIFEMGIHLKGYLSISQRRYENEKITVTIPKLVTVASQGTNKDPSISESPSGLPTIEFDNEDYVVPGKTKTVAVHDTRWLCEVGVPMIWHIGEFKNWEIQLEPYYHQIPNIKRTHILGSRLTFGYRY